MIIAAPRPRGLPQLQHCNLPLMDWLDGMFLLGSWKAEPWPGIECWPRSEDRLMGDSVACREDETDTGYW